MQIEIKTEVKGIDLLSNSSLNMSTASNTEENQLDDAHWLNDVQFAIEGFTQFFVDLVGLVGKIARLN